MLESFEKEGIKYYQSGLVGNVVLKKGKFIREIPEYKLAVLKEQQNELINRSNKVNIFFVVEGTDSAYAYKQHLIQAIKNINSDVLRKVPEVNFGALVYRDLPEEKVTINGQVFNRLTEHKALTPDLNEVINFLQKVEFKNKKDKDEYTALYYGLHQALQKNTFPKDELNIIMIIGCYGDFSSDSDRATVAGKHPAFFGDDKVKKITANLNAINAHLYAVQLRSDSYKPSRKFVQACQVLMLENAKFSYNKNMKKAQAEGGKINNQLKEYGLKMVSPSMEDEGETEEIPLKSRSYSRYLAQSTQRKIYSTCQNGKYPQNKCRGFFRIHALLARCGI